MGHKQERSGGGHVPWIMLLLSETSLWCRISVCAASSGVSNFPICCAFLSISMNKYYINGDKATALSSAHSLQGGGLIQGQL